MKHKNLLAMAISCIFAYLPAANADCISRQAAEAGAQQSLSQDQSEINQLNSAEKNASSQWGKCLGSVTGQIHYPTFPDMSKVFNSIKDKVCHIAASEIDKNMSQLNSSINDVYSSIPSSTTVPVVGNISTSSNTVDAGNLSSLYQRSWQ